MASGTPVYPSEWADAVVTLQQQLVDSISQDVYRSDRVENCIRKAAAHLELAELELREADDRENGHGDLPPHV